MHERFVYSLRDSRDQVFYVGSTRNPEQRRKAHYSAKTDVSDFIRDEAVAGRTVRMVIEFGGTTKEALDHERALIAEHARNSRLLFNKSTNAHAVVLESSIPIPKENEVAFPPRKVSPQKDKMKYWKRLAEIQRKKSRR